MFEKLSPAQQKEILELHIIEVGRCPEYTDNDRSKMKNFYRKKIKNLSSKSDS